MVGVNGKVLPGCLKYVGRRRYRFTRWKRFVESWGPASGTVRGDPKACWILGPDFPDCRFYMPSVVMGPSKEEYVWVINDA